MNRRQASAIASELLEKWGLLDWKFAVEGDRKRKVCGRCYWDRKLITVTDWYLELNDDHSIIDTIKHEIAHALTPIDDQHGPIWQAMAKRVGCDPKAKRSENTIRSLGPRYSARCCGVVYNRERSVSKNRRALCPRCRGHLSFVPNQPTIRTPSGEYLPRFAAQTAGPVELGVLDIDAVKRQLKAVTNQKEKRQLRSLLRKLGHHGGLKHEVKK